MSRLPIQLRLTLTFALAMIVVLASLGFFVYSRVDHTLTRSVDQSLRGQLVESSPRLDSERALVDRDAQAGATVAELIDRQGRVVRSTPPGLAAFISGRTLRGVLGGRRILVSRTLPGVTNHWRVLAAPVRSGTQALVIARSLESSDETLHHLLREYLIAAPLALLLASLAGYGLAISALRPVEAMRRRAAIVSASMPGQRLPMPRSRDSISRLAETLNEMLARLEAAFAHERRFVADASHELRTPLALLRTELELALRHPRSTEELERVIRTAVADTERLSRLADDLLLLAGADQGGLPLRTDRLAVDDVFAGTQRRFSTRAHELGRRLEVHWAPGLVVEADPDRLEQALGNLIDNALKHGAGVVLLSAHAGNGLVELHVEDEGVGFQADFAPHAFDRFSRPDLARSTAGSGLGLSIVQLIGRAHGGGAGIRNRPGGGADVWLALPADKPA